VPPSAPSPLEFVDVAQEVGLDFRHGAFRWDVSADPAAMLGGGVCWLDYDGDGWLDLFAVNSYAERESSRWERSGGLPRSALFRNVEGGFVNVGADSGADLAVRGNGCVAADLDLDGHMDLYVTTATFGALLWNNGDGTFTEGARAAGVAAYGWHTGAAVGDVNGDGWPDLFLSGYADLNNRKPEATLGFPSTHFGVRDLLFLSKGKGEDGAVMFREVGVDAGLEVVNLEYGLGALFTDLERDGDLDLYLANDTNPDRLYENVPWPGGAEADPAGLGFRFEERAAAAGVADPGAGMGVAAGDYDGDGRSDLFVTNARDQAHGMFRSNPPDENDPSYSDARAEAGPDLGDATGWGVSWADLDLDTDLDLFLVNGAIPVTDLRADAQPLQVLGNLADEGSPGLFEDLSAPTGVRAIGPLLARGSAAADYDNDGDLDVAVAEIGRPLVLLENTVGGRNWLAVELDGFHPGAEVAVVLPDGRTLRRELRSGSSYLSSEDPRAHFGLGAARRVRDVVVRWPGGEETRLGSVEANQRLAVEEPSPSSGPSYAQDDCVRRGMEGRSVPRIWNEVLLDAIRRDTPAPTVHARNLFHTSAAMWDAWAAYDPFADGYFVHEKHEAKNVQAARETAMSFAAYRVLLHRYSTAAGLGETFSQLAATMKSLCYRLDEVSTEGNSPSALGNRVAAAVIAYGRNDGSYERRRYIDTDYRPVNDPLVVAEPGAEMHDPNRWQPLALARIIAQNGLPVPGQVQSFIGSHWGQVKGFALPLPAEEGLPIDPGRPPTDAAYEQAAVEAIRYSSVLDPGDAKIIDISPGNRGGNQLGTNDGRGHPLNPATGAPYLPNPVPHGDFSRASAEFWADGPKSETPPGHWNVIANAVSDSRGPTQRAERAEWDVKLYFALNGAVHDAAVAAWGAKGYYDSARPISMIRYLAGRGELPLVPGLVEVVTRASSVPGGRHEHLRRHVGEIAIRAWHGGVRWIRAVEWVPYQLPTFVTPAFAGYVSGHSTFSRAAAEVLTAFTGSSYFPGGLYQWRVPAGTLLFEEGPSDDVTLQWATYFDAADDAGISRLYGGIHISADDFDGRKLGATCGKDAWALAQRYFDGSARA